MIGKIKLSNNNNIIKEKLIRIKMTNKKLSTINSFNQISDGEKLAVSIPIGANEKTDIPSQRHIIIIIPKAATER